MEIVIAPKKAVSGIVAALREPVCRFVRGFREAVKGVKQVTQENYLGNDGICLKNGLQLLNLFMDIGNNEGGLIHGWACLREKRRKRSSESFHSTSRH